MHHPTSAATHVEAHCCTGTSPGIAGQVPVRLELERGGSVEGRVGYEVHGPAYGPAVVVLGGISASRHLAATAGDPSPGWWPEVIGPGKALDPTRHRLIGVDYLGGPRSPVAQAQITTNDQARALLKVIRALGLPSVSIVGASYGGMVGLAAAVSAPRAVKSLVLFCAAHRPHPLGTAWRSIQRDVTRFGAKAGDPARGLALGRALAMTTYRSDVEFDSRFDHRVGADQKRAAFPVESYLGARGDDFARRFDADAFLRLSESIDLHDVDPSRVDCPHDLGVVRHGPAGAPLACG
jgi:homoserine O-acetyltransferase